MVGETAPDVGDTLLPGVGGVAGVGPLLAGLQAGVLVHQAYVQAAQEISRFLTGEERFDLTGVTVSALFIKDYLLLLALLHTPLELSLLSEAELLDLLPALIKVIKTGETFPLPPLVGQGVTTGQSNDGQHHTNCCGVLHHFHQTWDRRQSVRDQMASS